ncbi:MAG: helix-turn-helix domain-containing protein [Sphingobium sp.]|nr:helix-turn-helix domain-containing protein [Sphingobium sp.]
MSEQPIAADEDGTFGVSGAAARMRAAREAAGMTLKDIAETTRVPLRHLAALEEGNFSALPGTTYVSGFARAYARAVGIDEAELVQQLREEIGEAGGLGHSPYEFEEAVNPARIPPRWLAWTAALIALALAAGYGIWRMQLTTAPTDEQIAAEDNTASVPANNAAAAAPAPVTGPVVMTAADDVWIRIYQADGTRLYEGTLKRGESYTVPDSARDPMILTGRPDALAVTVGGQAIPQLGPPERTISDVPVSATALLARLKQPVAPEDNAAAPVETGNTASTTGVPPAPAPARRPNRASQPSTSQAQPSSGPASNAATP